MVLSGNLAAEGTHHGIARPYGEGFVYIMMLAVAIKVLTSSKWIK